MDLPLFLKVLGRHRALVAVGVGLAVLLAALSYVRPGLDGMKPVLSYREAETWQSQARLLVTLPGFSAGSTLVRGDARADAILRAEGRLSGLALLYAGLATSDEVTSIVRRSGRIKGRIVAAAATADGGTATLPIVNIIAVAPSGPSSRSLANRYANALRQYVAGQQVANDVPAKQRVALEVLNVGGRTELVGKRGTTLPLIVFLTILSATIGIAFVRENLRGSARESAEAGSPEEVIVAPAPSPVLEFETPETEVTPATAVAEPDPDGLHPRAVVELEETPVIELEPREELGRPEEPEEATADRVRRWA